MSPHWNSPFTWSGPRERLLAPSEYSGSGTRLVGEISNERAGYLHFHGFFAFAYLCSGILDFNFISMRNHSAVAKGNDVVLASMARSYSTPVRRISRSISCDPKLARLGSNSTEAGIENCCARSRIL